MLLNNKRIFVVEDQLDNRAIIRILLEMASHRCYIDFNAPAERRVSTDGDNDV